MAPSAPLPLPPPAPLNAFLDGDGTVHPSNGHDSPPDSPSDSRPEDIPPLLPTPPKLPGKSNLKRYSMFGSPPQLNHQQVPIRHTQSFAGHVDNGLLADHPTTMTDKDSGCGPPKSDLSSNGGDVAVVDMDDDYIPCMKRKDSRVTWTDNHGKDLAEVWEFEPSDTGDSDEESDSDSSQACTCVIQ